MAHYETHDPLDSYGLTTWYGQPPLMQRSHRHNEIELNMVGGGSISYMFTGRRIVVAPGRFTAFWAAVPHQIVAADPGAMLWWLTLPLAVVLRWQLPGELTNRLLHGYPVIEVDTSSSGRDEEFVRQWRADMASSLPERRRIVLLEVEARLRRLALSLETPPPPVGPGRVVPTDDGVSRAEAMATYIAEHFGEPLTVSEVARAVGLQPNYAMTLFRQTFGMTIVDYLTQYRVAAAQRLLATTGASVVEIALGSGFGSLSRFYVAFRRGCGQSPLAYRRAVNGEPTRESAAPG